MLKNASFPFQYMKVRSQVWMHCVCVTSYPQTNGLSQLSLGVSCCHVILLHCLPLCIYSLHVCLCVYHVLSRPVLLFTVTVKLLSRVLLVRPRLSAQVLLCFVCDWKRSQRETEEMTEINWMYRGEGILKEILTQSDRDLGSHSFLSVKVTRAITRHIDECTLSEGMCSVDWRSVIIFSWEYMPESLALWLLLKHMVNSRSFKYLL